MQRTNGFRSRKVKAIVFDMDNTLFDFVEAKLKACRAVVEYLGVGDEEELLKYFLRGLQGLRIPKTLQTTCKIREFIVRRNTRSVAESMRTSSSTTLSHILK